MAITKTSEPRHGQPITEGDNPTRQMRRFIDELAVVVQQLQSVSVTAAQLVDKADPVNTQFKFLFKFNTTAGKPYFPTGSDVLDPWVDADGLNPITPS